MDDPGGTLRVLVADDNRDAADILAELLRSSGCLASIAYDGSQALALVAEQRPDVAILDLDMPGCSGLEVARAIRCDLHLDECLCVCLTGMSRCDLQGTARDAGFDEVLMKPLNVEDLFRLLEAWKVR
ncbi:MAG TPA: response regulator [Burkholderiaceae bacterium]|nr:response regulator [Burkholderiaceae bacterium]